MKKVGVVMGGGSLSLRPPIPHCLAGSLGLRRRMVEALLKALATASHAQRRWEVSPRGSQ